MTRIIWGIVLLLGVSHESVGCFAAKQELHVDSERLYSAGMSAYTVLFVDLVFRSKAIAEGRVTEIVRSRTGSEPESLKFEVIRSFRQDLPRQLHVVFPEVHSHAEVDVQQGSSCLLFLQSVDGERAMLFGNAHLAIWPRSTADWLFTLGHVQPLDVLVQIVEELLKVDSCDSYDDRARMLTDSLFLANPLGQIAALQYANSQERWPAEQLQGNVGLRTIRRLLVERLLMRNQRLDIYATFSLCDLMRDLPLSIAIPKWIDCLSDPDVSLREASFTPLKTEAERWMSDDFGYGARTAMHAREQSIAHWQVWFESIEVALLKEEVPDLLRQLKSQVVFERESADLALQLISNLDQKFNAEDNEVNRDAAAKRWDDWWKRKQQDLKKK